jgi:hypothetical protein
VEAVVVAGDVVLIGGDDLAQVDGGGHGRHGTTLSSPISAR